MTIRFRVWDGEEMIYPDDDDCYLLKSGGLVYCGVYPDGTPFECEKAIAMLSTGLTDKNGKEIWAGDVCKFLYSEGGDVVNEFGRDHFIGEIGYCVEVGGLAVLKYPGKVAELCTVGMVMIKYPCEVIGSIHENPELLEVIE